MSRRVPTRKIFVNAAATTISAGFRVSDFRTGVISIIGSPTANMTVFVKGSLGTGDTGETSPDFTVTRSNREATNNAWDFIEVVDLEDGSLLDGDEGISLSANRVRLVELNTNHLDWVAIHATAIVAGTVTIVGSFVTNE